MKKVISLIIGVLLLTVTGCQNKEENSHISKIDDYLYEYTLQDDSYWENRGVSTNNNIINFDCINFIEKDLLFLYNKFDVDKKKVICRDQFSGDSV